MDVAKSVSTVATNAVFFLMLEFMGSMSLRPRWLYDRTDPFHGSRHNAYACDVHLNGSHWCVKNIY